MNLGPLETTLVAALRGALGDGIACRRGPLAVSAASGLQPEVFVHAARFEDMGAAAAGHWPLDLPKASGWREDRPARIEVDIACVALRHEGALDLCAQVAPAVYETLSRLPVLRLSDPADALRTLRFDSHDVVLVQQRSGPAGEAAQALLSFRLTGVLHVAIAAADGLAALDPYAAPLALRLEADPAGVDIGAERVLLQLQPRGQALDLAGWSLADAAGQVYRFQPGTRLAPGQELSLWTGRGKADALNVYWGRRKAVWNNTGDVAVLRDPEGGERARASWQPPLPAAKRAARKKAQKG